MSRDNMNNEIEDNNDLLANQEPSDYRPNVISLGDGEDGACYLCGVCEKEFSVKFGEDGSYNYPERCPNCNIKFVLGDGMCISNNIWSEIEGTDVDKKCKCGCFYERLCEKNDEDIKLCGKIRKNINLADGMDIVEYSDIENVKKYVDKILKLEKNAGVTFSLITDHTGDLVCPTCEGTVFSELSNSDSFICITCYRKRYTEYGWCDLDYYYILDDMIEREKVKRLLQDSGNLDATKKLLNDHEKKSKKNKEYSNIGESLLSMDELTVANMNKLLYQLDQDYTLYDTKDDAIEYIKNESKRYNFDLIIDDDDDKRRGYDAYISWNGYKILSGFIEICEDSKDKWWIWFRYFYIGNN